MEIEKFKKFRRTSLKLDATPMTDVIFLLLIFFMISSSFMLQPGLKVKLPKTVSREVHVEDKIMLTVTKDGIIFVNKKPVTIDNLGEEIKTIFLQREDKTLMIRADEAVLYGLVVTVMDIAKQNGAEKLAIATEIKKADGK